MAISDLFSTPFIFSLLIIIVLLGVLYAYFNYKLSEQDHKINSMFGLVKSMADEMQFIRGQHRNPINLEYATQLIHDTNESDNESEEDDSEEDDSDNEENDNELISVSDADTNEDTDEDEGDEDTLYSEDGEDLEIEDLIFNHDLENEIKTIHLEEPIDINTDFEPMDLNFTAVSDVVERPDTVERPDSVENQVQINSIDDDNIVDPDKINILSELIAINDDVNASNIVPEVSKQDFKKLSINKLREIIVEKGLIVDASKLKKNEILKMLGEE
jgi:hypothetical protein